MRGRWAFGADSEHEDEDGDGDAEVNQLRRDMERDVELQNAQVSCRGWNREYKSANLPIDRER